MEHSLRKYILSPSIFSLLATLLCNEFVRSALVLTVLPLYLTTNVGLSKTVMGTALAIHYLLDDLLRTPAGWITDRLGPKVPLVTGVTIELLAVFTLTHTDTIPFVFLGCGLLGVGTSVIWPSIITGVTNHFERDHATVMGIIIQFSMLGAGLGPILINLITDASERTAFLFLLGALGVVWCIVIFFKDDPTHNLSHNKKMKPLQAQYWQTLKEQLKSVRSLFPGMFAQSFALGLMIPVLTLYANDELHLSHWWFSIILASGGSVTILLIIPFGRIVDRYGGRYLMVAGFISCAVLFVILPFTRIISFLLLLVCLIGFSYAMILPSWNGLLDRCIPADKRGAMWGIFMTIEGIGTAAGPITGGTLYDLAGPTAPFWTSAGVFAVMAFVYLRHPLLRNWKPREGR